MKRGFWNGMSFLHHHCFVEDDSTSWTVRMRSEIPMHIVTDVMMWIYQVHRRLNSLKQSMAQNSSAELQDAYRDGTRQQWVVGFSEKCEKIKRRLAEFFCGLYMFNFSRNIAAMRSTSRLLRLKFIEHDPKAFRILTSSEAGIAYWSLRFRYQWHQSNARNYVHKLRNHA